jgi:hypothetical protein
MHNELNIARPFGPAIAKAKLSTALVDRLNEKMTAALSDFSDNLVGKVTEELRFDEETQQFVTEQLKDLFSAYHQNARSVKNIFVPEENRPSKAKELTVHTLAAWYVRQFKHEYNPVHIHSGGTISCVGYLSLPENIAQEFMEDEKDHHPTNGRIEFMFGTAGHHYINANQIIKPKVGDFYIFPSSLWHTVYPFTSEGERRSFSMNVAVTES